MDERSYFSMLFLSLVATFETNALGALGLADDANVSRDPQIARTSIDILRMLHNLGEGNLNTEEATTISRTISALELSYIEHSGGGDSDA